MMYTFMTLNDETEIVHSEMRPDGTVKVYMERPNDKPGFDRATCYLPSYAWEDIAGFTPEEVDNLRDIISSTAHLILEYSQKGGILHAANS